MKTKIISRIFFLIFISSSCNAQTNNDLENNAILIHREPEFSARFYAGNKQTLQEQLNIFFASAKQEKDDDLAALIVPHAGYVFSGEIAANGYSKINTTKNYDNIFILATSHTAHFEGASIYNLGYYKTPLGMVKVNLDLANQLIDENEYFFHHPKAHMGEHCLEVQLPFLQHIYEKEINIVPISIGTADLSIIKTISDALKPYYNDNNLFIVSSDFSHYPAYDDAVMVDGKTANTLLENSPDKLIEALDEIRAKKINNQATSMCGWSAGLTLLNLTENDPTIEVEKLKYCNSGDIEIGDKNRVVGYWAISFSRTKESDFTLDENEKEKLLTIAEKTLQGYLKNNKMIKYDKDSLSENLKTPCGAFVSLYNGGNLRGCIGTFSADDELYTTIQRMAISAATKDRRFTPVTADELKKVSVEISVLTPLKQIEDTSEIEIGKHGIYIKKDGRGGTLLPQVASERGWSVEEFLGYCSKNKAGLGWDGWKEAEIFTYEAIIFGDKH